MSEAWEERLNNLLDDLESQVFNICGRGLAGEDVAEVFDKDRSSRDETRALIHRIVADRQARKVDVQKAVDAICEMWQPYLRRVIEPKVTAIIEESIGERECVWTLQENRHEAIRVYVRSCNGGSTLKYGQFCPACGGRIKEETNG